MSDSKTQSIAGEFEAPNAQTEYLVTAADLPLHCPTPAMSKWNSHPKIFIPIEETGEAICSYCGAVYKLSK